MTKTRGRDRDHRTEMVYLRMTEAEKAALCRMAEDAGVPMAEQVRRLYLRGLASLEDDTQRAEALELALGAALETLPPEDRERVAARIAAAVKR